MVQCGDSREHHQGLAAVTGARLDRPNEIQIAFTMAGMHVPIYLVAKGITTWYESMVFSIAKLIVDPAVGVFALAAFTTWRLLERNARWCWRRMRVFLFREALFIGRRVVWNSISIPFRNFYRELIYLWRTVHADRRTAIM